MEFSRTQHRLFSFAVSAMLTSAFLATAPDSTVKAAAGPEPQAMIHSLAGLRNAGFQGMGGVALPPPAVAPQMSAQPVTAPDAVGLTAVQLQKLDGYMPKFGLNITLVKVVSDALGVTRGAEIITVRQLAIGEAPNPEHVFSRVPAGGYLYMMATTTEVRSFYID